MNGAKKKRPNSKQEKPPEEPLELVQQMTTKLDQMSVELTKTKEELQKRDRLLQKNIRLKKQLREELLLIKERDKFSYQQANDVFRSVLKKTNAWLKAMSLKNDMRGNWWQYQFRGHIEKTKTDKTEGTHDKALWYRLRLVRREAHLLSDVQKKKMISTSSDPHDTRPAEVVVIESQISMTLQKVHVSTIAVFDIPRLGIFRDMDQIVKRFKDNPLNSSVMEGKKFASLITHISFMLSFKFLEFIREHYWIHKSHYELREFDTNANVSIYPTTEATKHIMQTYYSRISTSSDSRADKAYKVFDTSGPRLTEEFIQQLIDDWKEETETHEQTHEVKANPSKLSRFNARF